MPGGMTGRGRRMPSSIRVAGVAVAVALVAIIAAVAIVAPEFPSGMIPFGAPDSPASERRGSTATTAGERSPGEAAATATGQASGESALSDADGPPPDSADSATPRAAAAGGNGADPSDALRHDASAGWAMPDVDPVPTQTPFTIAGDLTAQPPLSIGTGAVRVDPALLPLIPRATQQEQAVLAETVAMGGLLPTNRILAYYGHPHDANMGILGEYDKTDLLALLQAEAANYEAADPTRPVIPAFEVIATVAQGWPAQDGQYLLDTDVETLEEYADFAEANGILLFLDLQIGRNTIPAEIEKVRPLLERPHVHLALDPEFAVADGQVPGTHLGEVTAEHLNEAQEILANIVREGGLPPKILIVHQFREDMILGKERLRPVPGVQLVIESDGFGAPSVKIEVYDVLIRDDGFEYPGVKHFYRQDVPVMTASETLALDPPPLVVIYQ